MSKFKKYVPVIRWKAAEKEAVEKLSPSEKAYVIPLIELIMPQPTVEKPGEERKSPEELLADSKAKLVKALPKIAEEILKYWGNMPLFLEFNLIDVSLRTLAMKQILIDGRNLGLRIIPTIKLNAGEEIENTLKELKDKLYSGVALRLYRHDLNTAEISSLIRKFLSDNLLSAKQVDLIVDLQITDENCLRIKEIINKIPNINDWNSFTVISGAFPKDLSNLSVDTHMIERSDWNKWFLQIDEGKLERNPSFGDYTIQHPIYTEPIPGVNPSASIRYTLNDAWMIMRGQGLRGENSAGHAQYPANAQLLLKSQEYFGKDFSYGDAYIEEKGKDVNTKETGTPRTWIRAGINHHIACVVKQLSNLGD